MTMWKRILPITLLIALVLGVGLWRPVPDAMAQRFTPNPDRQGSGGIVQVTVPAFGNRQDGSLQATAQAAQANIQMTAAAFQQNASGTVQAIQTNAARSVEEIQATVQAVQTEIPATVQGLVAEQIAVLVEEIAALGDVVIDREAQALTVTLALEESTVNEVLSLALTEAGFSQSAASVDFIEQGVFITLEDVSIPDTQLSGQVQVFATVGAVDGRVTLNVVSITLNGQPLPAAAQANLNAILQASLQPALIPVQYTVISLFTTDSTLVMTVLVPFAVAG